MVLYANYSFFVWTSFFSETVKRKNYFVAAGTAGELKKRRE
jgi:hypothetical protein